MEALSYCPPTFKEWYQSKLSQSELARSKLYASLEKSRDSQTTEFKNIKLPEIEKIQESYDPRLGLFVSTLPEHQIGTSVVTRTPTIDESKRIRDAQLRGSLFDRPISEIKREAEVTEKNIKKFQQLSEELESKSREIEELERGNVEGGLWVGSEKDFEVYQRKFQDYEKKIEQVQEIKGVQLEGEQLYFKEPTIGVGLGVDKRQVPLSRFDTKTTTGLYSSLFGYGAERALVSAGYPEEGKFEQVKIPEGEFKLWSGTGIYDPIKGQYEPQVFTIPETTRVETVLPSARTTGEIIATGRYFIPYVGAPLFFGEMAGKGAELTAQEGDLLKGGKSFIKTYPEETLFLGGYVAYRVGSGIWRGVRKPTGIRLFDEPEIIIRRGKADLVVNPITGKLEVPKVSVVKQEEILQPFLKKVPKGKELSLEFYTKEAIPVSVLEKRAIPLWDRKIRLDSRGVSISPRLQTTKGTGVLSPKGYVELIPYTDRGRKFLKLTKVDPKGKGEVRLFRKEGEKYELFKTLKTKPQEPIKLSEKRPKIEKVKFDEQFGFPFIKKEVQVGGRKETRLFTREGERVISDRPINLDSVKVTGEFGTTIREGKSLKEGVFRFEAQDYGFWDIVQVGARKGLVRVRTPKGKIVTMRTQVGQDIIYGVPKEVDLTFKTLGSEGRIISPKSTRLTTEQTGFRFVDVKVKPTSKILKPQRELERIRQQEIRRQVKEIEKMQNEWLKAERSQLRSQRLKEFKDKIRSLKDRLKKKPKEEIVVYEAPSYTGGGQLLESPLSQLPREFQRMDLSQEFFVSPPKLKGAKDLGFSMPTFGLEKTQPKTKITNIKPLLVETKTQQGLMDTGLDIKTLQETKIETKMETPLKTEMRLETPIKTEMRLETPIKMEMKTQSILKTQNLLQTKNIMQNVMKNLMLKQVLKQSLVTKQALKQVPIQTNILKTTSTKRPIIKPKIKIPIKIPLLTSGEKEGKIKGLDEDEFEVFKKIKGEPVLIGREPTEFEAFKKLKKGLKETLSASGWVERGGKKLDVGKFTSPEFRPAKKSKEILVQKRGFRLGTGQEVFQIQQARKKGGFKI